MLQELLLTVSPLIVAYGTQLVKKIPVVDAVTKPNRKALLRIVVALLSVGASAGAYALGGEFDPSVLQQLITAVAIFFGTSIPYWIGKGGK